MSSSIASSSSSSIPEGPYFVKVDKESSRFKTVEQVYSRIATVAGDQTSLINEIKLGERVRCELLEEDAKPLGLITYEKATTDETFVLRTFTLVNPKNNTGKGYGRDLINRVIKLARRVSAKKVSISLPETAEQAISFLIKHNFTASSSDSSSSSQTQLKTLSLSIPSSTEQKIPERASGRKRGREEESTSTSSTTVLPAERPKFRRSSSSSSSIIPDSTLSSYAVAHHFSPPAFGVTTPLYPTQQTQDLQTRTTTAVTRQVTLKKIYIQQIRSGQKTVEGRINSGMFRNFRAGDKVRFFYFSNSSDDVTCEILSVKSYRSFREMLQGEGFRNCLPESPTLEHAVGEYDKIPGYASKALQNGVLAIALRLLRQ